MVEPLKEKKSTSLLVGSAKTKHKRSDTERLLKIISADGSATDVDSRVNPDSSIATTLIQVQREIQYPIFVLHLIY
jgi:hypothetical protein